MRAFSLSDPFSRKVVVAPRAHSERGGVAVILVPILLVLVAAFGIAYVPGVTIPPGFMGVRRVSFGPGQGYWDETLPAGHHWAIPWFFKHSTVYLVPTTIQTVDFHRNHSQYPDSLGVLDVQTVDGNEVLVDISLLVRFLEGKTDEHGGPADLLKSYTVHPEEWRKRIGNTASDELRHALHNLSASDFYDPFKRENYLRKARGAMNQALAPVGISVEHVLLRRYTYVAEEIDNAIFEKNLEEQKMRLNATSKDLAATKAELEEQRAFWDAKIKTLLVEGESKAKVTRSEAELYEQRKVADGDLKVAMAHAEVDRLRAGVLAGNDGADIYVARELAPILASLKGGVITDVDPYDLERWVERLGVDPEAASRAPRSGQARGSSVRLTEREPNS